MLPRAKGCRLEKETGGGTAGRRVSPLELGPPVGWPVQYRVSGPDLREVRAISLWSPLARTPLSGAMRCPPPAISGDGRQAFPAMIQGQEADGTLVRKEPQCRRLARRGETRLTATARWQAPRRRPQATAPSRTLPNSSASEASPTTGYSNHGSRIAPSATAGQNRTRLAGQFGAMLGRRAAMQFSKWVSNSAVPMEDRVASIASAHVERRYDAELLRSECFGPFQETDGIVEYVMLPVDAGRFGSTFNVALCRRRSWLSPGRTIGLWRNRRTGLR
jgi:hypothetical protein